MSCSQAGPHSPNIINSPSLWPELPIVWVAVLIGWGARLMFNHTVVSMEPGKSEKPWIMREQDPKDKND